MSKVQDSKKDVHDDMSEDSRDFATLQGAIMSRLLLDELTDGSSEKEDEKSELTGFRAVSSSLIAKLQAEMVGASHDEMIARIKLMDIDYEALTGNHDNTDFTNWLTSSDDAPKAVNCWEAIIYAAVEGALTTRAKLAAICKKGSDNDYSSTKLAKEVTNYKGSVPLTVNSDGVPTNVAKGDVVFLMGLAHVALATDKAGSVVQVWGARSRKSTISAIMAELKGTMNAQQIRNSAIDERNNVTDTELDNSILNESYEIEDEAELLAYLVENGFAEVRVAKPRWP